MGKTGFFVGNDAGHVVTPCERRVKAKSRVNKGNRVKFIRGVIRQTVGYAPYEKRLIEMFKADDAKRSKKAVQITRKRLGTQRRALRKQAELVEAIESQKKI